MQRARLFDALLAGPVRTAAIAGRRHGAARSCPSGTRTFCGPVTASCRRAAAGLHVYAVDISRSADGRWWALADRTQAPSGPGYALENRQIVSRVFPDLLSDLGVRSLGGFFGALRENLLRHAPDGEVAAGRGADARAPSTKPISSTPTLPGSWGCRLVEGHDLTVRGDTVCLKTLGGLRRVHAILRRLDDDFCDPVELRADSALGVPGLIAVVRAGNVVVANALGSGVLESAAWMGFIPRGGGAAAGREAAPAIGGDVVVRREARTRLCHREYRAPGHQAGVPQSKISGDIRSRSDCGQRARRCWSASPPARTPTWRRSGSPSPRRRCGAAAAPKTLQRTGARHSGLCDRDAERLQSHAGRPGADRRSITPISSRCNAAAAARMCGCWPRIADPRTSRSSSGPVPRLLARHDELPSRLAENLFWLGRYTRTVRGQGAPVARDAWACAPMWRCGHRRWKPVGISSSCRRAPRGSCRCSRKAIPWASRPI